MGTRFHDVVKENQQVAESLVELWSTHASAVASKLDAQSYDAAGAFADLVETAALAAESGLLLGSQAIGAVAILTGSQHEPRVAYSALFDAPLPDATLTIGQPLTLDDPFTPTRSGVLNATIVCLQPSAHAPDTQAFRLRAVVTGHPGGTYIGTVNAVNATASESRTVYLSIS